MRALLSHHLLFSAWSAIWVISRLGDSACSFAPAFLSSGLLWAPGLSLLTECLQCADRVMFVTPCDEQCPYLLERWLLFLIFMCMHVFLPHPHPHPRVCMHSQVSAEAHRVQKRALDPLELQL